MEPAKPGQKSEPHCFFFFLQLSWHDWGSVQPGPRYRDQYLSVGFLLFLCLFGFIFDWTSVLGARTRRSDGDAPCHRAPYSANALCGSIFRGWGPKALIKILQRKPGDSLHAAAASRGDSLHSNRRRDAGERTRLGPITHTHTRARAARTHTAGALCTHIHAL